MYIWEVVGVLCLISCLTTQMFYSIVLLLPKLLLSDFVYSAFSFSFSM